MNGISFIYFGPTPVGFSPVEEIVQDMSAGPS